MNQRIRKILIIFSLLCISNQLVLIWKLSSSEVKFETQKSNTKNTSQLESQNPFAQTKGISEGGMRNYSRQEIFPIYSKEICQDKDSIAPFPGAKYLTLKKYDRIKQAQKVVAHIIKRLEAPVSLMYGTLLHEFRNGTSPCVQYNLRDKDFDIASFENYFYHITNMTNEIEKIFGWKVKYLNKDRLFLMLVPGDQRKATNWNYDKDSFQIDVYGFKLNYPEKGLIHFPWDKVTVATNVFLPLVKHKMIANDKKNYLYRPFNTSCLLPNLYGLDFMTPKKGKFLRQTAYGNPVCDESASLLSDEERVELSLHSDMN